MSLYTWKLNKSSALFSCWDMSFVDTWIKLWNLLYLTRTHEGHCSQQTWWVVCLFFSPRLHPHQLMEKSQRMSAQKKIIQKQKNWHKNTRFITPRPNRVVLIGEFCNVFKFHAYSVNKSLLLTTTKTTRGLPNLARTNVYKVNSSNKNHIEKKHMSEMAHH